MNASSSQVVRLVIFAAIAGGCVHRGTTPATPGTMFDEVASASAPPIHLAPGEPIERALKARATGVDVTSAPDGTLSVRIHGPSSYLGSNEPLYVIDGMPIAPGPHGALSGMSAFDIESIRVLKDPASLTEYGSRGANGVIIIVTRRPGARSP